MYIKYKYLSMNIDRINFTYLTITVFILMYKVINWSIPILMKRIEVPYYIYLVKAVVITLLTVPIFMEIHSYNRKVEEIDGIKKLPIKLY